MPTSTLYDLSAEYRSVMERVEDAGGELTPELESELDSISGSLKSKVDACLAMEAEMESKVVGVQAQIDRLVKLKASRQRAADSMKAYVLTCLQSAGERRLETERFTVRVQASPASARWVGDPDSIPEAYRRVKTTVEFNKTVALRDFKGGIPLPSEIVVTQSTHLVIR